ncbi:hypothetical protein Tco_0716166 [Tanacetum coccineum]
MTNPTLHPWRVKGKKKSQIVSQPKPKTQGPKAFRELPQKRKYPKTQKTPIVQATITPPTKEGISNSQPLLESKKFDLKDSEGNKHPTNLGLLATHPNEGIHPPLSGTGAEYHVDKTQSIRFVVSVLDQHQSKNSSEVELDVNPLILTSVADIQALLEEDELIEESDDVFEAEEEMDEEIPKPDTKETQTHHSTKTPTKELDAEDYWVNHEEVPISYVDLKAAVEGYYEENVDHRVQTDKLVKETITALTRLVKQELSRESLSESPLGSVAIPLVPKHEVNATVRKENLEKQVIVLQKAPSYTEGEQVSILNTTKEPEVEDIEKEPEVAYKEKRVQECQVSRLLLTDTILEITILQSENSQAPPMRDRGKGIARDTDEYLRKLMPASKEVRQDLDAPILVPYEITGKMYQLTEEQIQAHLDKENKLKKAEREAKLLEMNKSKLIKVVHKEAANAGVDPKILARAKGGQDFRKIQDAKIKVLNKEHSKKIKKETKLRRKMIDNYK